MIKVGDKVRPCKGYMVNLMVVEVEDPLPGVVDGSIYSFHYYKVAPWVERTVFHADDIFGPAWSWWLRADKILRVKD